MTNLKSDSKKENKTEVVVEIDPVELRKVELKKMSKEDLIEMILKLEATKKSGTSRKEEVLNLLKENPMSTKELAEKIGISEKNISSQIFYLRNPKTGSGEKIHLAKSSKLHLITAEMTLEQKLSIFES